jgi:hypothetical protein
MPGHSAGLFSFEAMTMTTTTTTTTDHDTDRAWLADLLRALGASDIALRREQCRGERGDYAITGKFGHVYAAGDGFLLVVTTGESTRRWSNVKSRLAFCRVTQDGDDEGILRLDRLPTGPEATAIREALGIRKRREMTPEAIERSSTVLRLAREAAKSTSSAPGSI